MTEEKTVLSEEEARAEAAKQWVDYVINESDAHVKAFAQLAKSGNIGVNYIRPVKDRYEDHEELYNDRAIGVRIIIELDFEKTLYFTDEEGYLKK